MEIPSTNKNNPQQMPTLAWSYARVSSSLQAGADRSGVERQEQALAAWLHDHPDLTLAEHLADLGLSASKGDHRSRGALGRFLAAADAGQVPAGSVLIVESLTRFSRENERQVLALLQRLWELGIGLAVCSHGTCYTAELIDAEPHRLHMLIGSMGQARAEADERSRRALGAAARRRDQQDQGQAPPAHHPWWLERNQAGQWLLLERPAATVRHAFTLAREGLGFARIATALNDGSFSPPPVAQAWRSGTVGPMLRSLAATGALVRKDATLPDYYPAVVTRAEFDEAQQAINRRKRFRPASANSLKCLNLFEGVSRCVYCDGPISYQSAGSKVRPGHPGYVHCRNAIRDRSCSHNTMLWADGWHAHCLVRLREAEWEQYLGGPDHGQGLAARQAQVEALTARLATLKAVVAANERRAEDEWAAAPGTERLATIERLLARQRTELQGLAAEQHDAAEALALEQAMPAPAEAAAEWRATVVSFIQGAATAPDGERLRFNRWLASRLPAISLLLDVPAKGERRGETRVALQVGDGEPDWQPLDRELAIHALASGASGGVFFGGIEGGLGAGVEWEE